eukprot:TRINITY_DN1490_c0_g1_i1.p1 TRINITY_DN1490_c0_g1~~TRINITY_DN1490_c0_g1_i1.p1  ORF type:complete len:169 (+),score=83.53 TRINITY_DN1490_c0_g1_i1:322-828(+)
MLSNLASYIFGSSDASESLLVHPGPGGASSGSGASLEEEGGWVLVGASPSHDLNLGSIHDIPGSLLPSEDDEQEETRSVSTIGDSEARLGGPRPNNTSLAAANLARSKAISSAQTALQRRTKKALSAKMLERQNKAVKMSSSCKKASAKNPHSFAIKSSGFNKQLKQC